MNTFFRKLGQKYHYSAILLRELVITDFKLRYQGSALGYVWSLLRPLLLFLILYVVFAQFLRFGDAIPHYPVYLLTGVMLWNFFSEVTNNSVNAIVGKGDLIRKINFPKYVIILATAASALINLALNLIVVGVFIAFSGVDITWSALWAPVYILEIIIFGVAMAFALSALFVRLRDVNYIWEVVLQAGFYATPIIYPLQLVNDQWHWAAQLLLLNPVAQAIQGLREALITPQTLTFTELIAPLYLLVPIGLVAVLAVAGALYFKKRSPYFAEEV